MELTVISGKGGTGKTTIAMALSELAKRTVKADCDVECPTCTFFTMEKVRKRPFFGEKKAVIDKKLCTNCKSCEKICHFAQSQTAKWMFLKCEGCGACTLVCPQMPSV